MTVNHGHIFLLVLAAAATFSCSKRGTDAPDAGGREIVFGLDGVGFTVDVTKADVTALSTLNIVCTSGEEGSETERWSLADADVSGGSVATGRYWPSSGDYSSLGGYHFYAANTALHTGTSGAYTDTLTNSSDIVCASVISPAYGTSNALVCGHVFAKLGNVVMTPAVAGYSVSALSVYLNDVGTGGVYHLNGGTWTDGTAAGRWRIVYKSASFSSTSPYTSTTYKNRYIVPGSYVITADYKVTRGNYTYTVPSGTPKSVIVTLPAGQRSNIYITIPVEETGAIRASVSVEEWDTCDRSVGASEWKAAL